MQILGEVLEGGQVPQDSDAEVRSSSGRFRYRG